MWVRLLICLLCMLAPLIGRADDVPAKPYRVMMMLYRGQTDAEKGFIDYFKRRNIPVEFIIRDAQADNAKIADFIREAKEIHPDLIYTFGTTVTADVAGLEGQVDASKNITDIPVVFDIVADPVGAKLVKSLKSSGRNVTGASHMVPLAAQLSALQSMKKAQKIGVLYNPLEQNSVLTVQELQALAPKYGLALDAVPVGLDDAKRPTILGLISAMHELVEKNPQFIYIPSDSFIIKNAATVVQTAQAAHIPVFSATETPIRDDGALVGLVSTYFNVGELAAYKAEEILTKKKTPSQIPVESLNRFTYLVNMGAAKRLGVYPPLSVVKIAELVHSKDNVDARE